MQARVLVAGSANMDLVVQTPRFPAPGETLLGGAFATHPGGKGANQAVAAARCGADVSFCGKVGDDPFGRSLEKTMATAGVDVYGLVTDPAHPTGVAVITVDAAGQNTIVVAAGANGALQSTEIEPYLVGTGFLLMQLEIPVAVACNVLTRAHLNSVATVLNPAPATDLPIELYGMLDVITPNKTEAELLTGIRITDQRSCGEAADWFHIKGTPVVVITLGEDGCFVSGEGIRRIFPAPRVEALDTTAAGDAFNGALVAQMAAGADLEQAVSFANAYAALSTTRHGAQESMPSYAEAMQVLEAV